jgi:putative acetyltransferase
MGSTIPSPGIIKPGVTEPGVTEPGVTEPGVTGLGVTGPAASVRPVHESDVPAVVEIIRDVLAEFGLRFGEGSKTDEEVMNLPRAYADNGGAFWVASDAAGKIIGTCGVAPVGPGIYELRKMYLLPTARGLGVGQRLLDESIAWVRAQGGRRIVLDTTHQMTRAIAFYESNGFTRDDSQIRGSRCSRGYVNDL